MSVSQETSTDNKPPGSESINYSAGLLARNTVYSLIGHLLPLPVAVIAIPLIINGIGIDRFGVLTITWIVVGYFSLLDLGVGKATTKLVAEYTARGDGDQLRGLILSSFMILGLLGIAAGLLLAGLTGWLVGSILNIPDSLVDETQRAFYMLAPAIPAVLLISGARGVLEARQQFRIINIIKIPSAISTYAVPLLVLPFTTSLVPIVGLLTLTKIISLLFFASFCWTSLPASGSTKPAGRKPIGRLLRFGGWLSVTHLTAPLLGYVDRFFIGSILTMTAVAFYATPYDVITRLFLIPTGILVVMFPAFSTFSVSDPGKLSTLYHRIIKYILFAMTPIALGAIAFAQPLIQLWLGEEFARNSGLVVQLLATGILFSCVARVAINATQAMGRPDIAAKFYVIELPIVLVALYLVTGTAGIVGVAAVWLARIVVEAVLMSFYATRMLSGTSGYIMLKTRGAFLWIAIVTAAGWSLSFVPGILLRSLLLSVLLLSALVGSWLYLFDDSEKNKASIGWQRISLKLFRPWGVSGG